MNKTMTLSARMAAMAQDELDYCREDPAYFIKTYCEIEDKDREGLLIPFDMWPSQEKALCSMMSHRRNIILKARQIGFTWLCLAYCLYDLIFHIGHTVIALSKTEDDAFELVRRFFVLSGGARGLLERCGIRVIKLNKSEVVVEKDGIQSRFIGFPSSSGAGRSFTANIIFLDEFALAQNAAQIWDSIIPTVNRPGADTKVIVLSTMIRGTKYEELWMDTENGFNRIFLGCFADPRRTRAWYDETMRMMGKKTLQEYPCTAEEALANLEGLFFDEFDPKVHIVKPFEIPRHWRIYSTMDYGLDKLAHYKIAEDENGRSYVFHEIYESGLIVEEASQKILDADEREGRPWTTPEERYAPPDLWAVSAQTGRSEAERFGDNGLDLTKTSNKRSSGWNSLKALLRGELGTPKLYIFSTCPNLIRTLGTICINEKDPNDCKKEPHELTHAPDALRYYAISRHEKADEEAPAKERMREWSEDLYEDYISASDEIRALIVRRHGIPSNYSI